MRTGMRWAACAAGVGLGLVPMTGSAQEQEAPGDVQEARRTLVMALPGTPVSSIWGLVGQLGVGVEHAVGSHVALVGSVQVSGGSRAPSLLYRGRAPPARRGAWGWIRACTST